MKNFNLYLLICWTLIPIAAYSQLGAQYYNGAFSMGMQGFSNHKGTEAVFTNPAGISDAKSKYGAIFNYTDQYGLGEISKVALGGRVKTNSGHFAIGLYQYGIQEYKEQSIALSYARSLFDNLQVGIQFNHNRLSINTYNSTSQNAVNLGMQSKVNKTLMISANLANIFKTQSGTYQSPQLIQFGVTYMPSAQLSFLVEAMKQSERPMSGIAAINYLPSEKLNLRMGIDITKGEIGLSAFYNMSKARVGFGYATHQNLGGSYALSGIID